MNLLAAGGHGDGSDGGHHAFDPAHHVHDAPYLDFSNPFAPHAKLNVNFFENSEYFHTSNTVIFIWITAIILLFAVLRAAASRKANPNAAPKGLVNAIEAMVVFIRDEVVYPNCGHKSGRVLLPFFLTTFFFILISNYIGMLPFSFTATSQYGVTITLAVIVWIVMFFGGFVAHGPKFLVHAVPMKLEMNAMIVIMAPIWLLLFVLEVIVGLIIKSFALMVRLKANMTAGHLVIFSLLFLPFKEQSYGMGAVGVVLSLIIMLLECLVCLLQAYVFTLLSAIFIGHSVNTEEHH